MNEKCALCGHERGHHAAWGCLYRKNDISDPTPDQVTRACEAYAAETGATWASPRGMRAALKAGL